MAGGAPIIKNQNKSWEVAPIDGSPSAVILNDLGILQDFNWQTLLDSADGYLFTV
jgi:hypothetical protein